ncbi:hypothetical protein NMY22_g13855 [Coprinellus aureogranulatus]|nr:hypothetical protein NMY22_g13855 [Coprinellus aureogranulatus]
MDLLQSQISRLATDIASSSLQHTDWPQTARDQALGCGEIVHEILECVSREGEHPKRDLSNAARVNRFFSNPSLDLLWKTMHSLGPFLLLLPYDEAVAQVNNSMKVLMTDTPATESRRFMSYANRLRHLDLDVRSQQSDAFPVLSLVRLSGLQTSTPLFPMLERITFASPEVSQLQAAYTELTKLSPITKVEFTGLHTETTTLIHALTFFSLNPHPLRELTLHFPEPNRYFDMGSLHYLQFFTALCTLSITSRNADFPIFDLVDWIAGLRSLRTLKIDIRVDRDAPDSIEHLHSKASLIRLICLAGPFPFIQSVLPIFLDVSEHVELEFVDVGSGEEGDDVEAYIRSLNHPSLDVNFKEPE